jgi:hypothetical protein
MNSKSKRRSIAAGILLVLALAAGGAYAYWTNSGGGSGTATTASPSGSQLSATNTSVSGLAPGAGSKSFTVNITNADPTNSYSATSLSAVVTTNQPGCDSTDYSVTLPTIGSPLAVAGGATVSAGSGSIDFINKATNQDACKGATVTLTYTVG